ncbi:hypothetical protein GOEFS_119_00080 [Gordonia effusa NBRC 100432]|uniref:Uncharacterized protein n=1 Tax=Gordonia effusa NBRC 100432 TaxID=1077974 RepID=H0R617_9ACTN|nr:hypothetical protein [Gordonia effusa]GAB20518.1 hypothetical protein GOEFS_119_00080 [Gordonia effusa NBRC 100432]
MKAFIVIDDTKTALEVDISTTNPEETLRALVNAPLDITPLGAHLILWSAYRPLIHPEARTNLLANEMVTRAGGFAEARVCGTAIITAHTDDGLIAPLSSAQISELTDLAEQIISTHQTDTPSGNSAVRELLADPRLKHLYDSVRGVSLSYLSSPAALYMCRMIAPKRGIDANPRDMVAALIELASHDPQRPEPQTLTPAALSGV